MVLGDGGGEGDFVEHVVDVNGVDAVVDLVQRRQVVS